MKIIYLIILLFTIIFLFSCNEESPTTTVPPGKLIIYSSPSEANIFLQGDSTEKITPDSFSLAQNTYEITLKKAEYDDTTFTVDISTNETSICFIVLRLPLSINVSYSKSIQPIFDSCCTSSGCHNDITRAGGTSLTSCSNAKADPTVVFPGEPDNSRLVWAIEGIGNYPMPPPGYELLTVEQINVIRIWIKEGAECN